MTSLWRTFKDYRETGALHALVNVHAAIDDHTFLTKRGDLLQVLSVQGVDDQCLDPMQLEHVARRFEAAMRTFDEGFRIYQYLVKRDHVPLTHQRCAHALAEQAVADRETYLQSPPGRLSSIAVYLVIVYEGWRPERSDSPLHWRTVGPALARRLSTAKTVAVLEEGIDRARDLLARQVDSFMTQLADTLPTARLDKQAVFRFLRELLNYDPAKARAVRLAYDGFVDFQACDSLLECHRDHLRLDDYFVEVLTLKTPPVHTVANLLKGLRATAGRFVAVSEWKRESNLAMRRLVQSKRRHFHSARTSIASHLTSNPQAGQTNMLVDPGADAVVGDLGACLEDLEVKGGYFGQYSFTIVLYDTDRSVLRRVAAECVKVFGTYDAQLIEERYNLLNAWLSALPGNSPHNLRRLWISNVNYADLSFLFAPREGEARNAHLNTESLAVLETEEGTPYHLNLHAGDNAHTLILGATGSGKSFLVNFLLSFLQRYAPRTTIFDLGGSYQTLTDMFGGAYLAVGRAAHDLAINPFSLPPTPDNLRFLRSFNRVLIESGGYAVTTADERDLAEQIDNLYTVEPSQRRLSTLANILSRPLRLELQKWVHGGACGSWFDHAEDTLTFASFQTVDFEGMDKVPDVLEPLLFYLLHRANAAIYDPALAMTFKVFVLDEAWRFFRHATIRRYLTEALKTWRKKGAAMILATQSAEDLVGSDMLAVIAESCATQMFLANPRMDAKVYQDIFHLNDTEAAWIARLIPKQQILVKQPGLAKVVHLNVDRRGYWLHTNSPSDNLKKRDAFERYGVARGLDILAGVTGDQGAPPCTPSVVPSF